jgi:hypothetical protein
VVLKIISFSPDQMLSPPTHGEDHPLPVLPMLCSPVGDAPIRPDVCRAVIVFLDDLLECARELRLSSGIPSHGSYSRRLGSRER